MLMRNFVLITTFTQPTLLSLPKNKTCSYFHFSLSLNSRHTFVSTQTAGVHIKKRDLKENRGITTATMKAQQQPKI